MKKQLAIAALGEVATGLLVLIYPSMIARLLFGAELSGTGVVMSRVAGIALIALGIACWPGSATAAHAFWGMVTYSTLATLYLAYLGIVGPWVGILLWPAVLLHALLTLLLIGAWFKDKKNDKRIIYELDQ